MDDYEGADRRREAEGWHLDKRVPIATLVAILTLALGAFCTSRRYALIWRFCASSRLPFRSWATRSWVATRMSP